jgi:hypothetical protein
MLEQDSYLLQNQLNPFPVSGQRLLDDDGVFTFTLDEEAGGASLGWLEKELGADGLADRIKQGERALFAFPLAGDHGALTQGRQVACKDTKRVR